MKNDPKILREQSLEIHSLKSYVLDHLISGRNRFVSLRERGLGFK